MRYPQYQSISNEQVNAERELKREIVQMITDNLKEFYPEGVPVRRYKLVLESIITTIDAYTQDVPFTEVQSLLYPQERP